MPWPKGAQPVAPPSDVSGTGQGETPDGPDTIFKRAQNAFDAAATPEPIRTSSGIGGMAKSVANDLGAGAVSLAAPLVHPVQFAKSLLPRGGPLQRTWETLGGLPAVMADRTIAPMLKAPNESWSDYAGRFAGQATSMVPQLMAAIGSPEVSEMGGNAAENLGNAMKTSGGKIIDRTAGVLKEDVSHGAQPGRAYLEGGGKPTLTMRGLADKAAKINSDTGKQLHNQYDTATQSGIKIPTSRVQAELQPPIDKARSIKLGPGGVNDTTQIDKYEDSFKPMLQAPDITPNQLWDAKRNVADNAIWNDPTQFNLNKLRQINTAGMGKILTESVPGTDRLNRIYQGTKNLSRRAGLRADSGQSPLTQMGRKMFEGAAGGAMGYAAHSPLLAAAPLIADTIPARTAAAYGLFQGGRVASPLLGPAFRSVGPLSAVSGMARPEFKPGDEK